SPAPPKANTKPNHKAELTRLRKQIDKLDTKLVSMLNERARHAVDIGKIKNAMPDGQRRIYASDREALLLNRLLELNKGPLPGRAIEAVYREIMSGSISLEQPVRIGFLGPAGSHSHDAAVRQFGSSVDFAYENVHTIAGVFTEVARGHCDYGIVPIENSTSGGVVDTLDAFLEQAGRVDIYAEVQISIHHALLAACKPKDVRRIYSKPQAFGQCNKWLGEQMAGRERLEAASTSRAVQQAVEENAKLQSMNMPLTTAAIASPLAAELYGLNVLFPAIEDNPNNVTRFFVIGKEQAGPTGDDKTSVMFTTEDRPGALVEVLGVFHAAGINLSHIDKRPTGRESWTYTFFVDLLGHKDEAIVQAALGRVSAHCKEMVVLGSYPRSKRIL
ncbi:MAG: prephenate dehydratase, partial [Planctomycetota bacterium]